VGGLPTTFVADMTINPRDRILVAATHGRGMFAMDVSYIQQLTPEVMASGLHVFQTEDVMAAAGGGRGFGRGGGGAEAYIGYWTGQAGPVSVVVQDKEGTEVARLGGTGDRGFNAVTWNLTRGSAGAGAPAGGRGGRGGGAARVDPGTYTIVVTQGSRTAEGSLVVVR
jgi:hypothetical protein